MIHKKLLIISTILALTVSFTASANKPIYKWKDSQGNIKYTQSKPPRGTDYETIYQRQSNNQEQQNTSERSESTNNVNTQDKILAAQEAEKKRVKDTNQEIKQKNCTIAKNNLATLTNSARVFTEVDGERRLLTDQERSDQLETAQSNVDKYCN